MSVIDEVLAANGTYSANFAGPPPGRPGRALAALACMDCRLDLGPALGLTIGDAHVIRNAGGLPTDDALRSLALSQRSLGTRAVMLIHHTGCGMQGFDDAAFRRELSADSDREPTWDVPGFADPEAQMRHSLAVVRTCGWLPHRDQVRGFVFDVDAGRLDEVLD